MFRLVTSSLLALARGSRRGGGVIINGHTLTRRQTRLQLDVLGRWFDFVSLAELPQCLARPAKRPFCLLTFDDGKRSNFTEIAPELEARRVPAVFYVTTEPLSNGTGLWFDRREQLVRQLGYCPDGLELPTLKQLPFDLLLARLDSACAHYGLKPDNEPDDLRPMSWDEARDLARRGFAIGAHGLTHAILTNETRARALAEIGASLARVSSELGAPCRTFAFPNGNYTEELAQHATRCGATTVMTTEPMWLERDVALWRLPRIQIFGEFSPARIELKLALAAQPGVLANPDGSGRTYRSRSRPRVGRDRAGVKPAPERKHRPSSNFAK
ncbi:MAG TPA: polysaccharide deacetylase family protein [Verrucomicrobiae bacterium]|nr:polysaccharide deacetylase family protein [Verrucomicrobiae bacterium]